MFRHQKLLGLMLLAGLSAHCTTDAKSVPPPPATLLPIRYERTGGFAGTHDVIEITPDGVVVVQGKLMGTAKGQLTRDEVADLANLFAKWGTYLNDYPELPGAADTFHYSIRFGTKTVTAGQLNGSLPASFKAIQAALEKIAQDLKK